MLLPYFIVGDFNVTISAKERRGGTKVRDPFEERIEDMISLWGLQTSNQKMVLLLGGTKELAQAT